MFSWLRPKPVSQSALQRIEQLESTQQAFLERAAGVLEAVRDSAAAFKAMGELRARVEACERRVSAAHDDLVSQISDARQRADRAMNAANGAVGGRAPRRDPRAAEMGANVLEALEDPSKLSALITELEQARASMNGHADESPAVLGAGGRRSPRA